MRPIWDIWHFVGFSYPFICFFTTTYLFSHQVGFLLNNIVQTVNILGHSGHFRSFSCPIQKSAQMGILPYFTTFSAKIMFGWSMVIAEEAIAYEDGLLRQVNLRVAYKQEDKSRFLVRPISKLVLLVGVDDQFD